MNFLNSLSHQADLAFFRKAMSQPILDREKEMFLACAWYEHQDEKALHELISSYTRLVISFSVRYKNYGLPIGDLIQEGSLGLLQAATRFEPQRDVRFSTYAKWWIRAYIQDFILRNWSIVRTGSTAAQKSLFFSLNRLRNQLTSITSEMMSVADQAKIAEHLNVSIQEVRDMEARLLKHDFSLNQSASEHGENDWQDLLHDTQPNPEETSILIHVEQSRHAWIAEAMNCLNPKEHLIITKRRLEEPCKTLEYLGRELSITKERVRQLEAKALRKMRYYFMESLYEVRQTL